MSKDRPRTVRVNHYRLEVEDKAWAYADRMTDVIDAYWQEALQRNPGYFDGQVFVLDDFTLRESRLDGAFRATKFSAYLHWRDNKFDPTFGRDGFVCAIVKASGGKVLMAEATAGTLNHGLRLFPGGMIDQRDVTRDGLIDIRSAARRELAEETGLGETEVQAEPHLYVDVCDHLVALGVPFVSDLAALELTHRIERHLATQEKPELVAPIFAEPADIRARDKTPEYVRRLLTYMSNEASQR